MRPIGLFWWSHRDPRITNVGDALSPLIVAAVSGRPVEHAPIDRCDLIAIGSIVEIAVRAGRRAPLAVWGSGFITDGPPSEDTPFGSAAMRGPLSASRVSGARSVGDPGLLASDLLAPRGAASIAIGLVPHYRDLDHPVVAALRSGSGRCRVISPLLPPLEFLAAISSCEAVLSSSLHGLVVADSYGVPNAWIEFGDAVIGAGYKFRDYLGVFGIRDAAPIRISHPDQVSASLAEAAGVRYDRTGIDAIRAALRKSFPAFG